MIRTAIRWFLDSSLFDFPRTLRALPGDRSAINSNGSVKQFLAADLPTATTETPGQDRQLSKAVLSSDTRLGEFRSGLSRNDDSNMVCEAIRADARVKQESARTATN